MRTLALMVFLAGWSATNAWSADGQWHNFAAPSRRYAVRLHEGHAIGDCRFNRAQLINVKTGKVLHDFGSENDPSFEIGGYDQNSVVWSPDSRFVAVYSHTQRLGEPLVVKILGKSASKCVVPEITLPIDNAPANNNRWDPAWIKPVRWLSSSILLLNDSGEIQQQRVDGSLIQYSYDLQLHFDRRGRGILKSIKQREFTKE